MISIQANEMFNSCCNEFVIIVSVHDMSDFDDIARDTIKIMINIDFNNDEIPTKIYNNLKNFVKLFSSDYKFEKHSGYVDDEHFKFHQYKKFYYIGIDINKNDYEELKKYFICDKCLNIIHSSLRECHKCNLTGIKRAI